MFGAAKLSDDEVRSAAVGSRPELGRVVEALEPQVRLMVSVRLSPTPAQFDAIDELTQEVLLAVTTAIGRLETQTVDGLRAWLSGIVMRKVADLIRRRPGRRGNRPPVRSLDSTIASFSRAGPLWQLLSASGVSPESAAEHSELVEGLLATLGRLESQHREIITLAFFDQLPMSEIARQNGSSRPAASMLLIRALRVLRQQMVSSFEGEQGRGNAE